MQVYDLEELAIHTRYTVRVRNCGVIGAIYHVLFVMLVFFNDII